VVRFDALSDARFVPSLQDMGTLTPLNLVGSDIFPGANVLHQFVINTTSTRQFNIVGYTHENVVVVCAVARKG